jgi:hypothetical protein
MIMTGAIRTVLFEEVPESFTGISEIQVTNAGSGYTESPTVTITGDGTGAVASSSSCKWKNTKY